MKNKSLITQIYLIYYYCIQYTCCKLYAVFINGFNLNDVCMYVYKSFKIHIYANLQVFDVIKLKQSFAHIGTYVPISSDYSVYTLLYILSNMVVHS